MIRDWSLGVLSFALALAALLAAALVPSYWGAVDSRVIQLAGPDSRGFDPVLQEMAAAGDVGAARLLIRAAVLVDQPGAHQLEDRFLAPMRDGAGPGSGVLSNSPLAEILGEFAPPARDPPDPVICWALAEPARERLASALERAVNSTASGLLAARRLTNTVIFPPASSAAGHALDATLLVTAWLVESDVMAPRLQGELGAIVRSVNAGGDPRRLEEVCLSIHSLARRMDLRTLGVWLRVVQDTRTLDRVVRAAGGDTNHLAIAFAAIVLGDDPAAVGRYLDCHGAAGFADLRFALRHGRPALKELLHRQQRIATSSLQAYWSGMPVLGRLRDLVAMAEPRLHVLALATKYLLLADGLFLLARAGWYWRRALRGRPDVIRQESHATYHQATIALVGVLLLGFVIEPFFGQDPQRTRETFRWGFPAVRGPIRHQLAAAINPRMDQITLLTLVVFFVVQLAIYVFCLARLNEIKRQAVPSSVKLRLLDNEEAVFDSTLYVGIGGTVLGLVLLVLGLFKPGLMAAYSSTFFGIVFGALVKIAHVRPYRRRLILDIERAQRDVP